MVQLTLTDFGASGMLCDEVVRLAEWWAREFGEGNHLVVASRATSTRFREWEARALTRRERERVAAYFSAVARRALVRGGDAGARLARRRLVEASIAADLCAAGWDARRAASEARSVTTGRTCGSAA